MSDDDKRGKGVKPWEAPDSWRQKEKKGERAAEPDRPPQEEAKAEVPRYQDFKDLSFKVEPAFHAEFRQIAFDLGITHKALMQRMFYAYVASMKSKDGDAPK